MTRNTHQFRVSGDFFEKFSLSILFSLCDLIVEFYPDDWQVWQSNIHPSHIDLPIVYHSGLFSQCKLGRLMYFFALKVKICIPYSITVRNIVLATQYNILHIERGRQNAQSVDPLISEPAQNRKDPKISSNIFILLVINCEERRVTFFSFRVKKRKYFRD